LPIPTPKPTILATTGEELPMTMQIGFVGMDGVLIASDTQWTNNPRLRTNENWIGGRSHYNANKIMVSHERGMAISSARSMETAGTVAHKIISELKDEDFEYPILPIEGIGHRVLSSTTRQERGDAQCLVAMTRPTPQLFLFQFGTINNEYGPICQKMESYAIAGDNLNAAIFWAERYYEKLPIENLIPLAAHLISVAHKLNTGTISGLEIVLCTASGIRRLSGESIEKLEQKAKEWDKSISELVLNYRQQFTFAPNVVC
jgi:hypothetical protein